MSMKWWTAYSSPNHANRNARQRGRLVSTLIATMALSVAITGCSVLPDEPEEEDFSAIELPKISEKPTYEVTTKTLETKVQGSGRMLSLTEKTLYFTLEGKRLKKLYIQPGQQVEEGQLIAELDVDDLKKTLRTQSLAFKQQELQMKKTLQTKDEMDALEYEQAVLNFEQARQGLIDMQEEIDKAVLTAPYSGTVVGLSVQEGSQIKAYDAICTIADPNNLVVAATMSRDDLEKVAIGMEVQVDINNAGKFTGKVKQMPTTDTSNDNGGGGGQGGNQAPLRLDQFLLVDVKDLPKTVTRGTPLSIGVVTNRKENVVVIPTVALRTIGARAYVQIAEADGTKREVDVEIGQQTATDVEILQGLTPGQKVVGR
ncbi:efflux RND transporter periplasmic adaptor subunit [Cohnella panacarvi]|uniref:efflux RND transporter periplasmic adaptor subunit n=1 Tax=Cohnella panacarvi TaxID=400776 RepID=UPI00047875A3|nr:efflux RND transporter periplasmic adaptor subunit [Cohnella panacarvi]